MNRITRPSSCISEKSVYCAFTCLSSVLDLKLQSGNQGHSPDGNGDDAYPHLQVFSGQFTLFFVGTTDLVEDPNPCSISRAMWTAWLMCHATVQHRVLPPPLDLLWLATSKLWADGGSKILNHVIKACASFEWNLCDSWVHRLHKSRTFGRFGQGSGWDLGRRSEASHGKNQSVSAVRRVGYGCGSSRKLISASWSLLYFCFRNFI